MSHCHGLVIEYHFRSYCTHPCERLLIDSHWSPGHTGSSQMSLDTPMLRECNKYEPTRPNERVLFTHRLEHFSSSIYMCFSGALLDMISTTIRVGWHELIWNLSSVWQRAMSLRSYWKSPKLKYWIPAEKNMLSMSRNDWYRIFMKMKIRKESRRYRSRPRWYEHEMKWIE